MKKRDKVLAEWNSLMVHDVDINDSLEGEDVYSVALGFFRAHGFTWDEAHEMCSSKECVQ